MLTLRGILSAACTLILLSTGLVSVGAAHEEHGHTHQCICAKAKVDNGWCGHCDRGFVASLEIPSQDLYEMIDPHGHDVDLSQTSCPTCVSAAETDGFCEKCEIGFVDGRAYVSRLAYYLAGARDTPVPACSFCENPTEDPGWCDVCETGWAGGFRFRGRDGFDLVLAQYRKLEAAIQKSSDCRLCGVALFAGGRCPKCNIRYKEGVAQRAGDSSSSIQQRKLP